MSLSIISIICLFLLVNQINCQGYYSIIAPNIIKPNSDYNVAVGIHDTSEPSVVKVGIISSTYSNFKTIEILPYSTKLIYFEINELKPDKYSLTAEGTSGVIFTNETTLKFEPEQLSALIQTDKSMYKPGDIVRFRILLLDSNLKPIRDYGKVNIEIRDGKNNRIKNIQNISFINSIYMDEFQLSDLPVLGDWKINVNVLNEIHTKSFEVIEYILPKFDVSIETDRHAIYKDGKIIATIRAKSKSGKPIQGEATISIYPKFYGSIQPFIFDLITRKTIELNGKAYVEFNIKDELKFKEDYQRDIFLEAIVEEHPTGQKQNTTKIVTIHKDKYIIESVKIPEFYIPDVPFKATVKVVQHDGTPIEDPKNPIVAYLTKNYGSEEMFNKSEYPLGKDGVTNLHFTIPKDKDDQYSIIVSYLDVTTDVGSVQRKRLTTENFMQIDLLTENPLINEEISILVTSNQKMKYFFYHLIGRGNVLASNAVQVPLTNQHVFKFLSTFEMMPKMKLLVYFISNGELVYDEKIIDFEVDFLNHISIDAPTRVPPGQDIDITITTKPNSYIGLMAVDENTLSLKTGNNIGINEILKELNKFDNEMCTTTSACTPWQHTQVVTLTNSDYQIEKVMPTGSSPMFLTMEDNEGKMTTIKKTDIGPAHKFEVNTRPPLAGPFAFSKLPKPFWNRPRIYLMADIMDTWLFLNTTSGKEGRSTIHRTIPDNLGSWLLTGFSLNPVHGLGITKIPKKVQTFKPFYITTDLPYSVKMGEIISVPFILHNNLDRSIDVKVTLYNNAQEFDFIRVDNEINAPKIELYSRQTINVPANSVQSTSFMIRPKKLGPIDITASASNVTVGDNIKKTLLVEAEGKTQYVNRGLLIDLRTNPQQKENVTIEIPRNAIPDSTRIEVSVVGDILGPTLLNLDNLIRSPHGSGEQSMLDMATNILILEYLKKVNKLSPAIEIKARKNIDLGYQRILSYKHSDGSFSAFSDSDKNGSTWITAYAAKVLRQATEYTEIDETLIKAALEFLAKIQAPDGSIPEVGNPLKHQYASPNGTVALTAFALIGFLENTNQIPNYRSTIDKALGYVARNLESTKDLFTLAISVYALQIADHAAKDQFLLRLDSRSKNEGNKKWWTLSIPESEKMSPWYNKSWSLSIETSSYAALAFLEKNLLSEAFPILKWLVDQRNINGGFTSSQDTIVGLEALIKFSEKLSTTENNIQVLFEYGQGEEYRININPDNAMAVLSKEIIPTTRNITVTASGRGIALVQISYRYNVNVTKAWPRFTLDPQVNRISHTNYLHLSLCTTFVPVIGGSNESNMAIMEINFPSGFTVDLDTLPSLKGNPRIRNVETTNRNTKVIIYFDFLNRTEICPTIDAYKTHKIAKLKPTSVIIYDYYDNSRKARMFYYAPRSTLCDICEGSQCGNSCSERAEERQSDNGEDSKGSGNWISLSVPLFIITVITIKIIY